jgi:4,5:9,10-diseco-3-hydroxy-5,9,17-trioxoandrosta-1(10),2-diene-4-oate hydrolase
MHPMTTNLRAAVGAPEPVTWIDVGGTRLAVMRRGTGAPVLCLHAIGHGACDFEALAARIGADFEVIAPDWPAQGRSPDDGVAPDAAHYAALIGPIMDALRLERAILLGNSIGGAGALRFAADHPERVRALVLCNAGGLAAPSAVVRFLIGRFVAFFRAGENGKRWFRRGFRLYYSRVLRAAPARTQRERIVASAYEIARPLRQAWESFARPQADTRDLVPKVACPVWLAWAKDDSIIPWSGSKKAAARFADARVQLFRGGHAAFLEDPDRFAAGFLDFARRLLR